MEINELVTIPALDNIQDLVGKEIQYINSDDSDCIIIIYKGGYIALHSYYDEDCIDTYDLCIGDLFNYNYWAQEFKCELNALGNKFNELGYINKDKVNKFVEEKYELWKHKQKIDYEEKVKKYEQLKQELGL